MNNLIANISSALDAVDNAPTCLKDLVSTMSNLVSSLPLELRSFSRTDFDLCVIDPGGSETPLLCALCLIWNFTVPPALVGAESLLWLPSFTTKSGLGIG